MVKQIYKEFKLLLIIYPYINTLTLIMNKKFQ